MGRHCSADVRRRYQAGGEGQLRPLLLPPEAEGQRTRAGEGARGAGDAAWGPPEALRPEKSPPAAREKSPGGGEGCFQTPEVRCGERRAPGNGSRGWGAAGAPVLPRPHLGPRARRPASTWVRWARQGRLHIFARGT
ncbi:hypothetical protein MC885_003690 [Smutsia gigantea]|nr:hypothetical protein MC885_003690 [Smutsia gigantea]